MKKKNLLISAMAVVLAVAMMFGGTIAYLTDSTDEVENDFSTNQNGVELEETTGDDYDIVPGTSQDKDPVITAKYTLDSYVYVAVIDETNGLVDYYIANGWILLETDIENDAVIYYQLLIYDEDAADENGVCTTTLHVLEGDKVYYSSSITNEDLEDAENLTLSFEAAIIQAEPFASAEAAFLVLIGEGTVMNLTTGEVYCGECVENVQLHRECIKNCGCALAQAVYESNEGDTIILLEDVECHCELLIFHTLTIDLNGYTLTANNNQNGDYTFWVLTDLTIDGKTEGSAVEVNGADLMIIANAAALGLTEESMQSEDGYDWSDYFNYSELADYSPTVTMLGGTYTYSGSVGSCQAMINALNAEADETAENGYNELGSFYTLIMTDVTVIANTSATTKYGDDCYIICAMGPGNTTITNCTFNQEVEYGMIYMYYGAVMTIQDSTLTSSGGGIYNKLGDLTIGGNTTMDVAGAYIVATGTTKITGGTYTTSINDTDLSFTITDGEDFVTDRLVITGGTFNEDVSIYVPDGYTCVDNGDGTYTVS